MRDMQVDQEKKTFVGPCCVKANPEKLFEGGELNYGVEFSSHMGLKAYASYGGLTVEFKKTKEEIQAWLAPSNTQTQETEAPQDVVTSAHPVDQKEMPN